MIVIRHALLAKPLALSLSILSIVGCGRDLSFTNLFGETNAPTVNNQHNPASLNDTGVDFYINYKDFGPTKPTNPDPAEYIYPTFTTGLAPGQDAEFGRDKTADDDADGNNGFSFTKIDPITGEDLPMDTAQWGCVRDNVTKLVWEVKRKTGLHNASNKFVWYNPDDTTNGGDPGESFQSTQCPKANGSGSSTFIAGDTAQFAQQVNSERLCGRTNWRLPTVEELRSIMDYSQPILIDKKFFKEIELSTSYLWTSQTSYYDVKEAWAMAIREDYGRPTKKACEPPATESSLYFSYGVMLVSGDATY